jgi:hypothetical protein
MDENEREGAEYMKLSTSYAEARTALGEAFRNVIPCIDRPAIELDEFMEILYAGHVAEEAVARARELDRFIGLYENAKRRELMVMRDAICNIKIMFMSMPDRSVLPNNPCRDLPATDRGFL